jgi:mannose-6-phosphate isomerase
VPELLRLTDPAVPVPVIEPRPLGDGVFAYDSPAPEFRLYLAELSAATVALPGGGPRLVLCAGGSATLRSAAGSELTVSRGQSCFVSAADGAITASGPAVIFLGESGINC